MTCDRKWPKLLPNCFVEAIDQFGVRVRILGRRRVASGTPRSVAHLRLGAVHKAIYVRSMDLLVTVKAVLSRVPGHNAYKVAQQTTRRRLACASAHVSRRARRPPSFVFEQARPTCTGFSPASAPSSLCARLSVLLVFAFDQTFAVNFVTARTQGHPTWRLAHVHTHHSRYLSPRVPRFRR